VTSTAPIALGWSSSPSTTYLPIYDISRPKQPSNDIDVFLEPLMEDMKVLWEDRVKMMDASLKKKFTLNAIIFVTITDYRSLFLLLG
jgi:hypothetical protein